MPKRKDIKTILIIGSGPIVIGQACEFDYSGSQACKALREEGYRTVLINSNPATIMTDPDMADATYIEPLTVETIETIIIKEKPDALLPTLGGQTGLNLAYFLMKQGILKKYKVETIGAGIEAISRAEDRDIFRKSMADIGVGMPMSGIATTPAEGMEIGLRIGFPLILRPAYCLGGSGGSTAYNTEELEEALPRAISMSPVGQVLVEQSVSGWKEIEFEVIRDSADNVILITSMENFDPMGVHTGDSIVVAPAQTLSNPEHREFADICRRIIRKIGVSGSGANIQLAQDPADGRIVIIEVNPRLSRSSALASKATGFPIARVSAKLAVGYTLPEVINEITGKTSSFFEPALDYCVLKICRFTFEKFPAADTTLNTSMKAVGEAMAIGSTFNETLQKAIRSTETGRFGLGADGKDKISDEELNDPTDELNKIIAQKLIKPNDERLFYIRCALKSGMKVKEISDISGIDRWFLENILEIVLVEDLIRKYRRAENSALKIPDELLKKAKKNGFSDKQIAYLLNSTEQRVRNHRKKKMIRPVYKPVDTCAGEFKARNAYYYSSYETEDEAAPIDAKKVLILGGGPNRIGQGIEFDYCCCHASFALKEEKIMSIMVNCNPETVSTDYDTSDRLYFEPLTLEDVLNIADVEKPYGAIVQFGGQTPLNLAVALKKAGINILGTSPEAIDRAENRKKFQALVKKLGLIQPPNGIAVSLDSAVKIASKIGYPVVVRPSYVLGGRAMEIVYTDEELVRYVEIAVQASPEHPILIDKFLEDAIEVDVDAISDGKTCVIGGILEHIEEAGIHSGDSAMVLPPHTLSRDVIDRIRENTFSLAIELGVKGLLNIQFAVKNNIVYILEVNPRASRTIPFVSKAIGIPLAKLATKVMLGKSLKELGFTEEKKIKHFAVKESVFPFVKFPGVDVILGPEMKSTGEVMGIDETFGIAYAKSQVAAGQKLPASGNVFISVNDQHKRRIVPIAKNLLSMGFKLYSTSGTADTLKRNDIEVEPLPKLKEGRPNVIDLIKDGKIHLMINTPSGKATRQDEIKIRGQAIVHNIPLITTLAGAEASVAGIENIKSNKLTRVKSIQEYSRD